TNSAVKYVDFVHTFIFVLFALFVIIFAHFYLLFLFPVSTIDSRPLDALRRGCHSASAPPISSDLHRLCLCRQGRFCSLRGRARFAPKKRAGRGGNVSLFDNLTEIL
ncbi:MAG TPA: hypothetical protein H9703_07785, partial [Candidatus Faecalibacterium faecigallinarum]|nr:hypothetical protein [Candidatus Faecalibacterium faecigallinarum]